MGKKIKHGQWKKSVYMCFYVRMCLSIARNSFSQTFEETHKKREKKKRKEDLC